MTETIIKHCRMDWGMEIHKFTFVTGGCPIVALDSLGDLIGSLQYLYKQIAEGGIYQKGLPMEIKVAGGCGWTQIEQ
mgnify:CR=1 FL=1|jgi:hypothetical protein